MKPFSRQSVPGDARVPGSVDIDDFLAVIAQWGTKGTCDFDGGGVDIDDFLAVIANWGVCP